MTKSKKFSVLGLTFMLLLLPALAFSAGLVPCSGAADCDFDALMSLINKIINFILYVMAIPIAAIMFAYAGFLLVTAGGEAAHARTKAKSIFFNAVVGLIIAAAAWLIIKLLLSILGFQGAWIGF